MWGSERPLTSKNFTKTDQVNVLCLIHYVGWIIINGHLPTRPTETLWSKINTGKVWKSKQILLFAGYLVGNNVDNDQENGQTIYSSLFFQVPLFVHMLCYTSPTEFHWEVTKPIDEDKLCFPIILLDKIEYFPQPANQLTCFELVYQDHTHYDSIACWCRVWNSLSRHVQYHCQTSPTLPPYWSLWWSHMHHGGIPNTCHYVTSASARLRQFWFPLPGA